MNSCAKLALLGGALMLGTGPAAAVDFYLAAKPFTKTLPVSGGATMDVPMWGYVLDTGDGSPGSHCYDIANKGLRFACVNALASPQVPGPRLVVPPGASGLRIFLTNGLPEKTSIIITGQELPYSGRLVGPTWNDGNMGPRTDPAQRVRSYGVEAGRNGGRRAYIWTAAKDNPISRPGSFIYHSGTWPQKQVYMGLYGAVTKDAGAGEAYSGVPYDSEVVLFYSDVDPTLNKSIARRYDRNNPAYAGVKNYKTSIDYHPQWFLVNGEPYTAGMAPIPAANAGGNTLVRLFSAAGGTHVPTLQGLSWAIHAEDGFQYNYQNGAGPGDLAPRVQYSADLPPLKTKDATLVANNPGLYAVYDGNGYMTNPSDPGNFDQADEIGGMLRFLDVSAAP
jgi:FtsP/CotA-like multicopper oxidase with cupredoxin domain